jgi:hypothetical protein
MTTAKFISKVSAQESFAQEFECSDRTTRVDLAAIKDKANNVLGTGFALGWAVKFALHGLRLKEGDYIRVKGVNMTADDYTTRISAQEGYKAKSGGGIGKHSDKSIVSAKRLVRAFASDISFLIAKGIKVSDDTKQLAADAELELKYCFIDSWYGCDDATLKKHLKGMMKMCVEFDSIIALAKSEGWMEGHQKHSHAKEFEAYCAWRGID